MSSIVIDFLSTTTTSQTLRRKCQTFGKVLSYVLDKKRQRAYVVCSVTYDSAAAAIQAIQSLHKTNFDGSVIRVFFNNNPQRGNIISPAPSTTSSPFPSSSSSQDTRSRTYQNNSNNNGSFSYGSQSTSLINVADITTFIQAAKKLLQPEKLASHLMRYSSLWLKAWESYSFLTSFDLRELVITLSRTPQTMPNQFPPPGLDFCSNALCELISMTDIEDANDVSRVVSLVLSAITRLLLFRWNANKEDIKAKIELVLNKSSSLLKPSIPEQRKLGRKINDFFEELEKPWSIQIVTSNEQQQEEEEEEGSSIDLELSEKATEKQKQIGKLSFLVEWKVPTVEWISDINRFCPIKLPKMKVPEDRSCGVYDSVDEYFDTFAKLWTAVTFSDGCSVLNPLCHWNESNKECGHVLWPLDSSSHIRCSTKNCARNASLSCCNQRHQYGLCSVCAEKSKQFLRGPPGPRASTHIYDAVVNHFNWEGRLSLVRFQSRRPPQKEIHWNTTKRLQIANLVGVVKLSSFGASLSLRDDVWWFQVIPANKNDQARLESKNRQQGELTLSLVEIRDFGRTSRKVEFLTGSSVAVIDFLTFEPEYIPVLLALEAQKQQKPLQMLKLINTSRAEIHQPISEIPAASAPLLEQIKLKEPETDSKDHSDMDIGDYSQKSEVVEQISEMINNSTLEPIVQIRKEHFKRLVDEISELVVESTLDPGQLTSFIAALTHPVHCTQGPPGTGKSYLGVVLTRALLLIRKIWISIRPEIGTPPILIVSYKNHAVDELAADLVNSELSIDLIRIGKSEDSRLQRYNESHWLEHDCPELSLEKEKLQQLYDLRTLCTSKQDSRIPLSLSSQEFLLKNNSSSSSSSSAKPKKDLYKFAKSLGNMLISVFAMAENCFPSAFTGKFSSSSSSLSFDMIKKGLQNYHEEESSSFSSANETLLSSNLETLCKGIEHYRITNPFEILWKWMIGHKPLPQCSFSKQSCKAIVLEGYHFCQEHLCSFEGCDEEKQRSKQFCAKHSCQADECPKIRLADPHIYCEEHACFVCLLQENSKTKAAELAVDEYPRNVCENHTLCSAVVSSVACQNLALPGKNYCENHYSKQCQGITRSKKRCQNQAISHEIPYCKDHAFQAQQYKNRKQGRNAGNSTAIVEISRVIPEEFILKPNPIQSQDKRLKITRPISISPELPTSTASQLPPSTTATTKASSPPTTKASSPPTAETNQEKEKALEKGKEEALEIEELAPVDEESLQQQDNPDEIEESEHLQHIKDVYEFEQEDFKNKQQEKEKGEEEPNSPTETNSSTTQQEVSSVLILPKNWNWEMDLHERWEQIQLFIELEKKILRLIYCQLLHQVTETEKAFHEAKARSNARVYQGKAVISGTIVGCITRLESIRATNPFAIVVEEASEVSEPLLFSCFTDTCSKMELIGDHLQLQPSMSSKFDFEKFSHMNISMFERLVRAPPSHSIPFNVLSVQRRMRKSICDLTRDFYSDITQICDHKITGKKVIALKSHRQAPNWRVNGVYGNSSPMQQINLRECEGKGREVPGILPHIFFWTHEGNESLSTVGLSKVNHREAEMVKNLCQYIYLCGVPLSSIAVLSPYKGQINLIRDKLRAEKLWDFNSPQNSIRVSTVDRFQGDESDIVIISLVIDSKSRSPFVSLVNRMIVLLSRARLGMYIIANIKYFENKNVPHWEKTLSLLSLPAVADTTHDGDDEKEENKPTLEYNGVQIGKSLPICCPAHRKSSIQVTEPNQLKLGFCKELCSYVLDCGHQCNEVCHWPTGKHRTKCTQLLESNCKRHPEKIECHEVTSQFPAYLYHLDLAPLLRNYKCQKLVEVTKPCSHRERLRCHHEQDIASGRTPWPKCNQKAISKFIHPKCKHEIDCECWEFDHWSSVPSSIPSCSIDQSFTPACGHTISIACYLKEQYESKVLAFRCSKQVDITLPRCKHIANVSCQTAQTIFGTWSGTSISQLDIVIEKVPYGPRDGICTKKVTFKRLCGHSETMECNAAFDCAAHPTKCGEDVKVINTRCGHEVTVKCYEKQLFESGYFSLPLCTQMVQITRQCGHLTTVRCGYQDSLSPCTTECKIKSPMCGHEIIVPCNMIGTQIDIWPIEVTTRPEFKLLMENGILSYSLPNPSSDSFKRIKCNGKLIFKRNCGHQIEVKCQTAFEFLKTPSTIPKCSETVPIILFCGHTHDLSCDLAQKVSSNVSSSLFQCKEMVQKQCWNYQNCKQLVYTTCSSHKIVSCEAETNWSCPKGHLFSLQICKIGFPSSCPSCILKDIDDELQQQSQFKLELDAELMSLRGLVTNINSERIFYEKKHNLLEGYYGWLDNLEEWERSPFKLSVFPCFVVANSIKKATIPMINNVGLSIKAWFFSKLGIGAIRNQMAQINQKLFVFFGFGLTIKTLFHETQPSIPKKTCQHWASQFREEFFDSFVVADQQIYFWEPYCFVQTHQVELSEDVLQTIIRVAEKSSILPKFPHKFQERISFTIPQAPPTTSSVTKNQVFTMRSAKSLVGTACDGLKLFHPWNGDVMASRLFGTALEEKELWSKLSFSASSVGCNKLPNNNPFAGIKVIENILNSTTAGCGQMKENMKLLLSLEFDYHEASSDAKRTLEEFCHNAKATNRNLHPLILVAFARIVFKTDEIKKRICLNEFVELYPEAASLWLTEKEKDSPLKQAQQTSSSIENTIKERWEQLKLQESVRSLAMDTLLKLTGLSKVKDAALKIFKSAIAFQKMPPEARKKNNCLTLNFVFVGNPGTGKTTCARLFSEILRDSKMRANSNFIECTSQKVKDDGIDKFRDLIKNAMDGVLFIDEAHDLDPKSDPKGRPIVSELLTAAENNRDRISFILAGYQDDIASKLFSYNEGMPSRFEEVVFDDFTEQELRSIWDNLLNEREWIADEKASAVVIHRIAKGAKKKGFGNARTVRKYFELAIKSAMSNPNWSGDNLLLSPADIIGPCPDENEPKIKAILERINSNIGWRSIKQSVREIIELAKKNWQRELNGQEALPFFVNRLFIGNPGTGKTTCAVLYGQLLKCLNILTIGDVVIKTAHDFVGEYIGSSSTKTIEILKQAQGKVLVIDEAYALDDDLYGKQVLDTLVEKIQGTPSDDIAVLLLGYEDKMMEMIRKNNPGLARRFPRDYSFNFEDFTDEELHKIFLDSCKQKNLQLSSYRVGERAIDILSTQRHLPNFGNAGAVDLLIKNAIQKAAERTKGSNNSEIELIPEDIVGNAKVSNANQDPYAELRQLRNVDNIIQELEKLQASFIVAKREGEEHPIVGNFVFRGNPGTGKTTVARFMAKILFQLELIGTDKVLETSALGLTGEFLGQTKKKVLDVMAEARGGVLFIDEAYQLGKGYYSEEATTALVQGMTNESFKGSVVIVAGYTNEMDEMLNRNAGLKSRFTHFIDFKDWTIKDCIELIFSSAEKEGMTFVSEVKQILCDGFEKLIKLPGFGNARDCVALFKSIKENRAQRIVKLAACTHEKKITNEDVIQSVSEMVEQRKNPTSQQPTISIPSKIIQQQTQMQSQTNQHQQWQKKEEETETKKQKVDEKIEDGRDEGVPDQVWKELEEAKRKYNEEIAKLTAEKMMEEKRKQNAIKEKIAKILLCPAGFTWFHVGNGWRCGGGSHFVSDEQLRTQFTVTE